MNSYYSITENLKDYLISHAQVNTVVLGNITDIDLQKQTLFPLAQVIVDRGTFANNTISFGITVMVMDTVIQTSEDPLELNDVYTGLDNKQDVYNTTLAVLNGLQFNLKQGRLYQTYYHLNGEPTVTPFEDSYGNLLTGWKMDFVVSLPNTEVSSCAEFGLGDAILDTRVYTFDTTNVTMDNY
jgi:hypothetical protein